MYCNLNPQENHKVTKWSGCFIPADGVIFSAEIATVNTNNHALSIDWNSVQFHHFQIKVKSGDGDCRNETTDE